MYYIIIKQFGTWVTCGEEFATYEQAEQELERMQEADKINGDNIECRICEIKEVERVNKTKPYSVTVISTGKETEIFSTNNEAVAISKARKAHSQSSQWEIVEIRHRTDIGNMIIPFRVFVAERETGNVIDEIKGQDITEAIDYAIGLINEFEGEDHATGIYEPDHYDIINENGESYIY